MPRPPTLRLRSHRYLGGHPYFVTVCAHRRRMIFGAVHDGRAMPDALGRLVLDELEALEGHRPGVRVDSHVVMPNHVHAILWLESGDSPHSRRRPSRPGPERHGLSAVVGGWKAAVSREARRWNALPPHPIWQRGYWDHVIRCESDLRRVREYIETNPARWTLDRENPQASGRDPFDEWLEETDKLPGR